MLALTRRINEEVVIGDPDNPLGVIRVVSVHGDKVRLSFDFPRDVKINRKELADQKKQGGDQNAANKTGNKPGNPSGNREKTPTTTTEPGGNGTNNAARQSPMKPQGEERQSSAVDADNKAANQ